MGRGHYLGRGKTQWKCEVCVEKGHGELPRENSEAGSSSTLRGIELLYVGMASPVAIL